MLILPVLCVMAAFRNVFSDTPLTNAIKNGRYETLKKLVIDKRTPVTAEDVRDMLVYGTAEIARLLLDTEGGREFLTQGRIVDERIGITALMTAVVWKRYDVAKLLVEEYDVPVNQRDTNGHSVLHFFPSPEFVCFLLTRGGANEAVTEYVLSKQNLKETVGVDGGKAVIDGVDEAVVKESPQDGAVKKYAGVGEGKVPGLIDIGIKNRQFDETALTTAIKCGRVELARLLLLAGGDIDEAKLMKNPSVRKVAGILELTSSEDMDVKEDPGDVLRKVLNDEDFLRIMRDRGMSKKLKEIDDAIDNIKMGYCSI